MAKISELVKTYKLLNDPNAPDWNVRFVGGAVIALAVVAAAAALLWSSAPANDEASAPAAAASEEPADADKAACAPLTEGAPAGPPDPATGAGDPCVPTLP